MNKITEADLIELGQEIEAALTAAGIANEVFHDEDGDEGWHLTVGAGHEHYMEQGGAARELTLAYWTRDSTWYWDRVEADSKRSGPWPCRDLDAGSDVAQIVAYVRRNVTCNERDPEHINGEEGICDGCGDAIPASTPPYPADMTGTGRLCKPCAGQCGVDLNDVVPCTDCTGSPLFGRTEIEEHRRLTHAEQTGGQG